VARPLSEDKRSAIVGAAVRLVAAEGLGVATAAIAKEAGVSNGSLFTYFATKAELFNQLYVELKSGMASAAMHGLPARAGLRGQLFHVWSNWMGWALGNPEKRRALAQLGVSDEITPASRGAGHVAMAGIAALMERSRAKGPMREVPLGFVAAIMNSVAEATMDFMAQDPAHAEEHCRVGFEALWRAVS
jgi:AcrR family transcriptional regulator